MEAPTPGADDTRNNLRMHYETLGQRHQQLMVYVGNGLAAFFLVAFGLIAIRTGRETLAGFTMPHAMLALANILLYKFTSNRIWADYVFAYCTLALFTILVGSGGIDHTGPLWGYPMVAATISLMGARRGLVIAGAMLFIAVVLFWVPLPAIAVENYSLVYKTRFLASFATVILLTALHEYSYTRNQSELLHVSAQLDRLSQTDPLTGLPNRRHMRERLEAEASRHARHPQPYSILFGDIDDFKNINDIHGHHAGDAALQAVGQTLRGNLRQHDVVSRWGGEEFLVLLPDTGPALAGEVAEKLRASIAALDFRDGGERLALTMSFGVHTADGEGKIDSFINCADQKLYQAKKEGKNRVIGGLPAAA